MVQPQGRIFPIVYIHRPLYARYVKRIKELGEAKHCEITYDFEQQFFDIKGRSQQAVEEVIKHIWEGLLPRLYNRIDDDYFEGTYRSRKIVREEREWLEKNGSALNASEKGNKDGQTGSENGISTSSPGTPVAPRSGSSASAEPFRIVGRPLDLDALDDVDDKMSKIKIGDTDDEMQIKEFTRTFTFSKNIANPQEVLIGPPQNNMQAADYLRLVSEETNTECSLIDREIHIIGTDEESVQDALERFQNIQALYKFRRRPTTVVPCVHYPTQASYYGLYFCDLDRYAHKHFVDLYGDMLRPLYVLLPVFKDPKTGEFLKPKDLIDLPAPIRSPSSAPTVPVMTPQWGPQRPPGYGPPGAIRPMPPAMAMDVPRPGTPGSVTTPNPSTGMAPGEMPLWGENRGFSNNYASVPTPVRPNPASTYAQPSRSASASPAPSPTVDEDFPALPSAAPKRRAAPPTVAAQQKQPVRRVLRLNMQQSGNGSPQGQSLLEIARQINLHNMKTALTEGLNSVRRFKGEIRLEAKLGKVLWKNLTSEIQKKVWEFNDIKDIVVKEHGVKPVFNNVTTASEDIISGISDILPKPYTQVAYFEIHAQARNQPALPYKPVIMTMGQTVVELQKVILGQKKVTEIDWVSLDRKVDFQMSLTAQELGRTDVKPYSTFIKKVSISPMTRQMTYENVPDFLKVDYILHKQTTKYRIHFPFVVEITRVERLPLRPQKTNGYGAEKILGMTGKGQVWYDVQVFYVLHDDAFRSNLNLPVGKLAPWTVEEILGTGDQPAALVDYVKCLLLLVEKCDPKYR